MKTVTKNKLLAAWQYCDDNDKSTEFMLEYMQDMANVNLDCVINFIQKTTNKERQEYIRNIRKLFCCVENGFCLFESRDRVCTCSDKCKNQITK